MVVDYLKTLKETIEEIERLNNSGKLNNVYGETINILADRLKNIAESIFRSKK